LPTGWAPFETAFPFIFQGFFWSLSFCNFWRYFLIFYGRTRLNRNKKSFCSSKLLPFLNGGTAVSVGNAYTWVVLGIPLFPDPLFFGKLRSFLRDFFFLQLTWIHSTTLQFWRFDGVQLLALLGIRRPPFFGPFSISSPHVPQRR